MSQPLPKPLCGQLESIVKVAREVAEWAAAGSVDTGLSFLSFLELHRTDIPQC